MTLLLRSVVMSPKKLISKKELKSVYGIPYSFAHIARLEAAGKFPRRITLGQCRVAWFAEEVEFWIDERPRGRLANTSF
jgi:prophage regulatory protein